jgi:hypothetical protein
VPGVKVAVQVLPQLIPEGLLVTVPVPVPVSVTVKVAAVRLNEALTEVLPVSVIVHDPVPLHAPDQPANAEFVPAVAASVTFVPELKFALQEVPQLIPAGVLVTVPEPFPERVTLSVCTCTEL